MNRDISMEETQAKVVTELKRYILTIGLSAFALMLFAFDSTGVIDSRGLNLSLSENVFGQMPQLVLSHFRHWSAEHLFWDLGMFAVLAAVCERISRTGLVAVLAIGIFLIPLAVGIFEPAILTYRGLSGLDTALFGMAAVCLALTRISNGDSVEAWVYSILLLGLVLKTAHELAYGTVFVASTNFVAVPVAHIVGAIIGACVGFACFCRVGQTKVVAAKA